MPLHPNKKIAEKMYGTLPREWADCGSNSVFAISSAMSLNLFVREDQPTGMVMVTVNVEYSQTQRLSGLFTSSIENVVCNSKGTFEGIVLDHIQQYVINQG